MSANRIRSLAAAALLVPALVGASAALGGTAPAAARTEDRVGTASSTALAATNAPIIFVHGLDPIGTAGNSCSEAFGDMQSKLRSWGWTGPMYTVKYYTGDTGCQASIDHHGAHSQHYSGGHSGGSHTQNTDIRHLAYHLAWYINDHFPNRQVKLVGHSMGGVIIRYMIRKVQVDDVSFPKNLYIGDVVTFGTPHAGADSAKYCDWKQCLQLRPGSSFMNYLKTYASSPNANNGTDWTTIGAVDDGAVNEWSAVGMSAEHELFYLSSIDMDHSDYMHKTSTSSNADVRRKASSGWGNWYNAPYPVHWAWKALQRSDW